jgi:hypothetical protein
MEQGRQPWCRCLSIPVQVVRGEDALSTEPVAVSHDARQQMTQRRLHKRAGIGGHDQSQGDVFEQGGAFC